MNNNNELWFEIEEEPLRWQLPIGVLLDIYKQHGQVQDNIKDVVVKPLELIVHFQQVCHFILYF